MTYTFTTFITDTINEPWSKGTAVILVQVFYVVMLFLVVRDLFLVALMALGLLTPPASVRACNWTAALVTRYRQLGAVLFL